MKFRLVEEKRKFGTWSVNILNLDPEEITNEDRREYQNWLDGDKQPIFYCLSDLDQELLVVEHKFNGLFWRVFDGNEKMIDRMHNLKQKVGTEESFEERLNGVLGDKNMKILKEDFNKEYRFKFFYTGDVDHEIVIKADSLIHAWAQLGNEVRGYVMADGYLTRVALIGDYSDDYDEYENQMRPGKRTIKR